MIKLSPSFTFNELTSTSHTDLLIAQRQEALQPEILISLTTLAVTVLEPLRQAWDRPIKVNSGYRSLSVNTRIGGAKRSDHMTGSAADITVGEANKELWNLAQSLAEQGKIKFGQLILEPSWIHISLPTDRHKGEVLTYDFKKYTYIRTIS